MAEFEAAKDQKKKKKKKNKGAGPATATTMPSSASSVLNNFMKSIISVEDEDQVREEVDAGNKSTKNRLQNNNSKKANKISDDILKGQPSGKPAKSDD